MHRRHWNLSLSVGVLAVAGLFGGCPTAPTGTGTGTGAGAGGSTFNLPPVPVITADITRGVVPLTVTFSSDRSTDDGLIVSRAWDFGDGSRSQDIAPIHTYTTTGTFTVRLTLTDDAGLTASRTTTVIVSEAPQAVISVDRTASDSAPAIINFDGSASFVPGGTITQYNWAFGDGTTDVVPIVAHTYATPGTFRARLTVTDNNGITAFTDVLISIGFPKPSIELRVPPPSVTQVVASVDSPLWVQAVYSADPGVSRTIRAGIDGDRDICDAQAVVSSASQLATQLTLAGHADQDTGVRFTPDGARVLTCSVDGTLRLYSATSGDLVAAFTGVAPINAVAITPDGARFVYGQGNGQVIIRDLTSGTILRTLAGHTSSVRSVDVSRDGSRIVSGGSDRRAIVWNASDGTILRDLTHPLAVNAVAFSPADQNRIATGCEDSKARVFDASSGAATATFTHSAAVKAVALSPDGQTLLTGCSDKVARLWNVGSGAVVTNLNGHTNEVLAVAFSADGQQAVTGGADATVRTWQVSSGQQLKSAQPCASPVLAVTFNARGDKVASAIGARNAIQLDTVAGNGNDLNITYPQALSLKGVASLAQGNVARGNYFIWAEIDTDASDPVRSYANPALQVVGAYTDTINSDTPPIPLAPVSGADPNFAQAAVVVDPDASRQIFDIGPLNRGDRIFISLMTQPGFGETFRSAEDFSLMILDADQKLYAWYQSGFVLFNNQTRLIIGHSSPRYYVLTDAGNSVSIRVQRNTGLFEPRRQRIYVNFNGGTGISVGGEPAATIPRLNAADFNQYFTSSPPNWTDPNDTPVLQQVILQTLRNAYSGFNVEFTGSNESNQPPALPYQTLFVGGENALLYGIADYIDPRNDSQSGRAIVYALGVGAGTIQSPFVQNPVTSLTQLGNAIGIVGAHEVGHLLGLRHTEDGTDIMQSGGEGRDAGDPTIPRTFKSALVTASEQVLGLPALGIQDAPLYLTEVVGQSP